MKITIDDFKKIVGEQALHKAGVHAIGRAHTVATRWYCDKLTLRSACTGKCNECALYLKTAVEAMGKKQANNPYALFTWMVKDAQAKRIEAKGHAQVTVPETNMFGEQTERDPFDIFEETL